MEDILAYMILTFNESVTNYQVIKLDKKKGYERKSWEYRTLTSKSLQNGL